MAAKILFLNKDLQNKDYLLVLDKTTVGRASDNTLVIHDDSVSSHHCTILCHGEEVIVKDNDSKNGTFVDDSRVKGQVPVRSGQILRFGQVVARLEMDEADFEEPDTEVTTMATLKELEKQQRQQALQAARTARKELGDTGHDPDETVTFHKKLVEASGGSGLKPPPDPLYILPEPRRLSLTWIMVGVVAVAIVVVILIGVASKAG